MKQPSLLFTAIWTALLLASTVYAADIRLSSRCTLADAIIAANRDRPEGGCPAGRVVDTIILTQDITLRDELPVITSDIIIEGNGYAISGDNRYRIFHNDGGALTINDLTMVKGYVEGDLISNADGSLKIPTANPIGGAIVNWRGTVTISDSSFSDNLAERGGAIYNWEESGKRVSITNSTFSRNSADKGGAIYNYERTLSIINSTFSDNLAEYLGGAIHNRHAGNLRIINSIIAGGSKDACYSDSRLRHNISNFIQDGTCSPAFEGDPKLGELVVPEDGSPAYLPLLAGSRAIDAADDDYCPETDQIGAVRPQGAGCDIGAIEYAAPLKETT